MKRSLLLIILSFLAWGCDFRSAAIDTPKTAGSISGVVTVKKPAEAIIYIGMAKTLDELMLGRPEKALLLKSAGPFTFADVKPGTYRLGAYVDINGNTYPNIPMEPSILLQTEITVAPGESVENIKLEDFMNERDAAFKTPALVEQYEAQLFEIKELVEMAYQKLKTEESPLMREVMPSLRAMLYEAETTWAFAGNDADWEHIKALLEPVPDLAHGALEGRNLLGELRGCFVRAYVSEMDNTVQRYAVYVPEEYDGSRSFPLIVALHGGGGDHWAGMKMVTGSSANVLGGRESTRFFFPKALPPDFIIAAPYGHNYLGPGYRGKGEYDVLKVYKAMLSDYNIDAERVYLTGASKGGTGTWEIGLKYPELFAAIAPICGGTQGVRTMVKDIGDTRVYVFHGTKDLFIPVDHSRIMVALLAETGADVKYTERSDLGHEASALIYKDGKIFDLFRK